MKYLSHAATYFYGVRISFAKKERSSTVVFSITHLDVLGFNHIQFENLVDWVNHLAEYSYQYNTGAHQSLGGYSPFEVFYNRKPNGFVEAFDLVPSYTGNIEERASALKSWKEHCRNISNEANVKQTTSSEKMVDRHKITHPPSSYEIGEEVLIKLPRSDKKIKKGKNKPMVLKGIVKEKCNKYSYNVAYSREGGRSKVTRVSVDSLTAITRSEEIQKRKLDRQGVTNEKLTGMHNFIKRKI